MKEMNKKNYMSPMVEILNARVEKGFQTSGSSSTDPHSNMPSNIEGWEPNDNGGSGEGSEIVPSNMFD